MKAFVLAVVLFVCADLVGNSGHTLRAIGAGVGGVGHSLGTWVYQP